CLQYYNAPYSF
nr:immunoglobulin light chain junction region [Macaca mulatta]